MKRKILLLTIGCIFTVAALAAIQGYFIYNTYKLKEKEVRADIHKQLLELEDTKAFETIADDWMDKTRKFSKSYMAHKVKKTDYLKIISKSTDSLSRAIFKLLKERGITSQYKAHYSNYITSVVLETKDKTDTLYKGKLLLFGDDTKGRNEMISSQGSWKSQSSEQEEGNTLKTSKDFSFEVKIERYYNIDNWERLILGRMAGLFVFSVLLVAFVVILFYISLRNLITQKKISDIKTDFVNNITHEFKTPIATMEIAIKTFEKEGITEDQFKNSVAVIKRQNIRLQSLFGQVKDASLSSSSILKDSTSLSTYESISEIVNDFKIASPTADISLIAQSDITLQIASSHLTTILVNLLDNAVKYGADTIVVTVFNNLSNTTLLVQDNGSGIPEKEKTAIFDKFYRVQKGNIHNTKGLGLGLYYVSQIVYAYNGTISVSGTTDKGTLFTIILPRL